MTGGWGYGNLGDDAILVSTLGLLAKVGANQIVALTYQSDSSLLEGVTGARFVDSMGWRKACLGQSIRQSLGRSIYIARS